ncbi:MAG: hypothetical protein FJ134_13210 [Deltaproteobacteria bacterium]|nr:hypothetical protein [Deltaproteobacteria bacterium]
MEQVKCPGQDTRFWKPGDIFTAECPKCGAEIEFFKDDARRRCSWCGHLFYNPKIDLGCAEWCQYAEKCVPDLMKEKKAAQMFKELLGEKVQAALAAQPGAWEITEKGVNFAQDLLKSEGGDPKIVIAAVLLHRLGPEPARQFLTELETEPEIVDAVLELLTGRGGEKDLNRQIFQDVLALLQEPPETTPITRTALRLAGEAGR